MKRYLEILIKYSNEDLYSIISHVYLSKNNIKEGSDFLLDSAS